MFKKQQKDKKLSISSPIASPISTEFPLKDLEPRTAEPFNQFKQINWKSSDSIPKTPDSDTFDRTSDTKFDNFSTVILMCKYEFVGESNHELSIKPNEYVKLLDRIGDGWLRVKQVNKDKIGLIPASYVKIAVNDLINPITSQWLNEITYNYNSEYTYSSPVDDLFDFEKTYPVKVSVSNVLENNEKFWYRIDIKLNNGDSVYISKFYQDFYNLHILLSLLNYPNLPKLPQPIKSLYRDRNYYENLLIRCNELNVYLNKLIKLSDYQKSQEFYTWIVNANKITNPEETTNEFINEKLFKNSINLIDLVKTKVPSSLPKVNTMVNSPSLQSIGSLISRYNDNDSEISTSGTIKSTNSSPSSPRDSISSRSSPKTPSQFDDIPPLGSPITPVYENFQINDNFVEGFVKIKVKLNNKENDIIVLKIKNTNLNSMIYLKKLVSHKIYKDYDLINHYKLTVSGKHLNDDELLHYIKSNSKVCLNLVRVRGSI